MCVSDANSLLGSLMQPLELLYAFHFTKGNCLPGVRNPSSPLSLHSFPLFPISPFFPLCFLFVTLSVVSPINRVVVIPGSACATGVRGECLVSPIIVPVTAVSSARRSAPYPGGQIHSNTHRSVRDCLLVPPLLGNTRGHTGSN